MGFESTWQETDGLMLEKLCGGAFGVWETGKQQQYITTF